MNSPFKKLISSLFPQPLKLTHIAMNQHKRREKRKILPNKLNIFEIYSILIQLFNRLRSRSFSELTRQINPPTKNGHAPPTTKSRKSYQSVNPHCVRTR